MPAARVGFVGLYRDEETLQPVQYYCKLPDALEDRAVIAVDPMLATGGSATFAIDHLKDAGGERFTFACLVAAPEGVERLAQDHPDVPVVIDHMAWPDETTDPEEAPWTEFQAVADAPNAYVKISSLPRSAEDPWPYPDLHGYVRNLLEWFGADRLMLGSDYPWMGSWASYGECLSWVEEAEFASARDLAALSYRTFDALHG